MNYFFDVLTDVIVFALYGLIHSVLASEKIKIEVKKFLGKYIAFYRLGYNVLSLIGLYFTWEIIPQPSLQIYKLPYPFDLIVLIPQIIAIAGMMWCFRFISFREFAGLNQIDRFFKDDISKDELDEKYTLRIEGPYKYSRHPVYFFSIVFLLFRAEMSLFYLTMFVSFTAYFYIGSYFEEKKLIRLFGDVYKNYQMKVPGIIPYKLNSTF